MLVCSQDSSAQRPGKHTERPVELGNTVTPTWSIPVSPSLTFTSGSSEVSRPEAWLKLEESKWLTTLQTTRRGTLSPRSTTKGTLAARRCSSASWWSSAVARRSTRLQNAMETCKGYAAGSRPHLSRVRSSQDLHMHDHLMQLCRKCSTCCKITQTQSILYLNWITLVVLRVLLYSSLYIFYVY